MTQAYKELGLLMLLVGVCVLTFAAMVFFAEKVRMLYTLPKKTLLIFQDIVFGLDFIHDMLVRPILASIKVCSALAFLGNGDTT